MSKAVQFDEYGDIEVLHVRDVPKPTAGPGRVVVAVEAAGLNPGEAMVRKGAVHDRWPATFPSGQGSDFSGIVDSVGAGVTAFSVGDEVLGWTDERGSQAEFVAAPVEHIAAKPAGLSWDVAGSLHVAGSAAYAAVRAVALRPGDVVAVSAAAGGVGGTAVQLAARAGATVLGIAGAANHDWLRARGVTPVDYGDGPGAELADRLRAASPTGKVDAFVDLFGGGYVDMAVTELGVPADRVDTIIDFDAVERLGVKVEGTAAANTVEVLAELAELAASGELVVPIAATYELDDVRAAYRDLERRHSRGKIVLHPR